MGTCISFVALLCSLVIGLLFLGMVVWVWQRRPRASYCDEDVEAFKTILSELRARLHIQQKNCFILSDEQLTLPFWNSRSNLVFLSKQHMEAATRLSLFYKDFDVNHVDAFCVCLQVVKCCRHRAESFLFAVSVLC